MECVVDDAEAPHIDLLAVVLPVCHFRRDVICRAEDAFDLGGGRQKLRGASEITQFDFATAFSGWAIKEQDVFRLDISVHDTQSVHVLKDSG